MFDIPDLTETSFVILESEGYFFQKVLIKNEYNIHLTGCYVGTAYRYWDCRYDRIMSVVHLLYSGLWSCTSDGNRRYDIVHKVREENG